VLLAQVRAEEAQGQQQRQAAGLVQAEAHPHHIVRPAGGAGVGEGEVGQQGGLAAARVADYDEPAVALQRAGDGQRAQIALNVCRAW
jgi:hypothetical protein